MDATDAAPAWTTPNLHLASHLEGAYGHRCLGVVLSDRLDSRAVFRFRDTPELTQSLDLIAASGLNDTAEVRRVRSRLRAQAIAVVASARSAAR